MYITKDKKNRNTIEYKGVNNYNKKLKEVYKNIQNEIKNIVITRLHTQIYKLFKDTQKLKKENTIIKNDLVYILKRILDNKTEFSATNNCSNNLISNSCINSNSNINYSTTSLNKSKNSILSIERNSTKNTINNFSKTKISLMSAPATIDNYLNENNIKIDQNTYHFDKNKFNNVDNRIDSYINSLYKHNFVDSHIGSENNYNLNKSGGIYNELFNKKNQMIENNNLYKNYKSQKNIRTIAPERNDKEKSSLFKINKNLSVEHTKIHKNNNYYRNKSKKEHNKSANNNSLLYNVNMKKNETNQFLKNHLNKNGNNNAKKSSSKKNKFSSIRSPFLVNKF